MVKLTHRPGLSQHSKKISNPVINMMIFGMPWATIFCRKLRIAAQLKTMSHFLLKIIDNSLLTSEHINSLCDTTTIFVRSNNASFFNYEGYSRNHDFASRLARISASLIASGRGGIPSTLWMSPKDKSLQTLATLKLSEAIFS